ncbi:MAG: hypothetical protein KDE27_06485 [Planctomycetes bacterium]|nr:hypothetical protein [Planctomycetota bacterium]
MGKGRGPDGKFLPGHGLGGRPRRPDLYVIAEQKAREEGVDLAAKLWQLVQKLFELALAGDTGAARLLLDRLTDPDPIRVETTRDASFYCSMTEAERGARIAHLLAIADARRRAAEAAEAEQRNGEVDHGADE